MKNKYSFDYAKRNRANQRKVESNNSAIGSIFGENGYRVGYGFGGKAIFANFGSGFLRVHVK